MRYFVLGTLVLACVCIIGPMLRMRSGVLSRDGRVPHDAGRDEDRGNPAR